MSSRSTTSPARRYLRIALIALAIAIVLANAWNQSLEAHESAPPGSALAELETLDVRDAEPRTGYSREGFGRAWADVDDNGCDTRNDILARDLSEVTYTERDETCTISTGVFVDPYTGQEIEFQRGKTTSAAVQIDHVVPLLDAWRKGARSWDENTMALFANDPLNLLASDGSANQSKGARDASEWLPPDETFHCTYVARQIAVKSVYALAVTPAERDAMRTVLDACPSEPLPSAASTATADAVDPW
ncbi:HNH endonuclease family protein [Oerskovia flava]|uniref:HNH endonuclease family protein n=1 Tax=Oerskovia flava TaxID=2986422 RepID=UPI00223F3642|nr:HNH endonuclease family protein [Oerskovia sp. JB1-3-2]